LPSVKKYTRQKIYLSSVFILPSILHVALGKEIVCQVPDGLYSANNLALGNDPISGSVYKTPFQFSNEEAEQQRRIARTIEVGLHNPSQQ